MKVYTSGVNGNDLRVNINTTAPITAGKTSNTQVKDSLGCIPDQVRTATKRRSRIEGYFISSGQLSVDSSQIVRQEHIWNVILKKIGQRVEAINTLSYFN